MLNKGARIDHIQLALGHSDLSTTFGYATYYNTDIDKMVDLLD